MIRYRVYTELVNYDGTIALAKELLPDSFTVFKAEGYWHGIAEKTLVFEILCPVDDHRITDFAYHVKKHNAQERVMVTRDPDIGAFLL